MDMNKSFFLRKEDRAPKWQTIDATGQILGRLSTQIADILRGKNRPEYTPHADAGDYVIVVNCDKIKLTGEKWADKNYKAFSGWRGGLKSISARDLLAKDPAALIEHSVKGMLPRNKLGRQILKKLKVYAGSTHPHIAQAK